MEKYINVTLRIDPKVYNFIRLMAAKEGTKIWLLVEEALTTWYSWLYRASREEAEANEQETLAKEQLEADQLLVATWHKQHMARLHQLREAKHTKAMKSQRAWSRAYPGRGWPGAQVLRNNNSETADNVSNTTNE